MDISSHVWQACIYYTVKILAFNWCCYPKWQLDQNTRGLALKCYLFYVRLVCVLVVHASMSPCASSVSLLKWGGWANDSLVVENHVRQPDVFWGQPDLQHSIKLLRDPSQTIVLPLLRANGNTMFSHPFVNHAAAWRHLERSREEKACLLICLRISQ